MPVTDNRLYFFTDSYPFSVNYEWKRLEINHIVKSFAKLTVLPFTYKKEKAVIGLDQNVNVLNPTLGKTSHVKWYRLYFLFSGQLFYFLNEFFRYKVYRNKTHFNQWFLSSFYTYKLLRNANIKEIIDLPDKASGSSVLYFYWTMSNALIIPHLKKKYKKVVVRLHGFDLYTDRQNGYIPYQPEMLRKADLIVCISDHGKAYLSSKFPELQHKIVRHYLGVPVFGLNPGGKESDDFHIVSCSRVISLKRVEYIAYALERIPARIKWTHFGDGDFFSELKEIMDSLNLSQHIVNFKGWTGQDDLREFYANEHISAFLNVSWSEGLPVSVMEAASFGIPVIATNVGGTNEIVSAKNGLLINRDFKVEDLVEAIEDLRALPANTLEEMRKSSRNVVEEKFDFQRNVFEFEKVLLS